MLLANVLKTCFISYVALIVVELMIARRWKRFVLESIAVLAVTALALLIHEAETGKVAFGEVAPPARALALMFVATLLGIAARYLFYLKPGQFTWLGLLKPLSISPIVLLPLIGSVEGSSTLTGMQTVSFAFLAFQNGFFWQAVLDAARPTTASVSSVPSTSRGD